MNIRQYILEKKVDVTRAVKKAKKAHIEYIRFKKKGSMNMSKEADLKMARDNHLDAARFYKNPKKFKIA